MKFAKNTFPEGFEFDPYMGEGVGAVRLKVSGIKIFDEVDEGMGSTLAWRLVEPEMYKRGQELLIA